MLNGWINGITIHKLPSYFLSRFCLGGIKGQVQVPRHSRRSEKFDLSKRFDPFLFVSSIAFEPRSSSFFVFLRLKTSAEL